MLKATFRRHVTPIISTDASETKHLDLQRMADDLNGMFAQDCFYSAEAAQLGAKQSLERHPNMSPLLFTADSRPNEPSQS